MTFASTCVGFPAEPSVFQCPPVCQQLDGVSLHGLTNQEVLQVMKSTGQTVVLTLVRKKARAPERSLDKGGTGLIKLINNNTNE